ncbi:CBS domain-containing protein [Candidatus Woesearchaeota archaeon]|nr:MAG: CBS domain-containing protein [Candidatus Woesearchaeota archaeon]
MRKVKSGFRVIDAMTTKPLSVAPSTPLSSCAKLMRNHEVSSLVVKDGRNEESLLGILTVHDIVWKAVANGVDLEKTPAEEIMTSNLVCVHPGDDVLEAFKKMRVHQVRQLPVMDEGKMVGYLTLQDVLAVEPELFEIFAEKADLQRPGMQRTSAMHGLCEICGNACDELKEVRGSFVCSDCAASM